MRVRMPGTRIPARTSSQSHLLPDVFCMYSTEHMATNIQQVPVNTVCKKDMDVKVSTTVIQILKMIMPALTCFERLLIFSHSKRFEKNVMFLIIC